MSPALSRRSPPTCTRWLLRPRRPPRADRPGGGLAVHPAEAAPRTARRRRAVAGGQLDVEVDAPDGVTDEPDQHRGRPSRSAAPAPIDRIAALAVATADRRGQIDVPGRGRARPSRWSITLTGTGTEQPVFGHVVIIASARSPRATIVLEHQGSATLRQLGDRAGRRRRPGRARRPADCGRRRRARRPGRRSGSAGTRRSARWRVTFGGDLVRLVETVEYAGPGGRAEQLGLYFADAGQHLEHRLFVDHNAPHTKSNVDYRGALQGRARTRSGSATC